MVPPSSGKLERPWKQPGLENMSASDSTPVPVLLSSDNVFAETTFNTWTKTSIHVLFQQTPQSVSHQNLNKHPSILIEICHNWFIFSSFLKKKCIDMDLASRAAICSSQAMRQILDVSHRMWALRWICLEPRGSKWQRRRDSKLNTQPRSSKHS